MFEGGRLSAAIDQLCLPFCCVCVGGGGLSTSGDSDPFFPPVHPVLFFVYFYSGLECMGHIVAYVTHFLFFLDVWI